MNKILLPKSEYFKFGNPYSGSFTNEEIINNYYIELKDKYICKTWQGLLCSEKAENITEEYFETIPEVEQYLNNLFGFRGE
ncbi:MAG: hypothetical protein LBM93_00460 [Oscillospiraceae bacterium]|jgi:hypothetical protein|nr:hypothetical protein [Oscillospiraceae bacterium]